MEREGGSFRLRKPQDTRRRRGLECGSALSKPAGRDGGARTPGLAWQPPARAPPQAPRPEGRGNGRSQRGAEHPGRRAGTRLSALVARGDKARRNAPAHDPRPNLGPGESALSSSSPAPLPYRARLLRDTGRRPRGRSGLAGCWRQRVREAEGPPGGRACGPKRRGRGEAARAVPLGAAQVTSGQTRANPTPSRGRPCVSTPQIIVLIE